MGLAKADFYYGALLSQLVNSGFAPAIIEKGESRRIYKLANDYSDYTLYCKYIKSPKTNEKGSVTWNFIFSAEEVQVILTNTAIDMYGFVCGMENLRGSEIAFLTRAEVIQCIGEDYSSPERRVSIQLDKSGIRAFKVYGTAIEIKESPLKIIRNMDTRLQEFMPSRM